MKTIIWVLTAENAKVDPRIVEVHTTLAKAQARRVDLENTFGGNVTVDITHHILDLVEVLEDTKEKENQVAQAA